MLLKSCYYTECTLNINLHFIVSHILLATSVCSSKSWDELDLSTNLHLVRWAALIAGTSEEEFL